MADRVRPLSASAALFPLRIFLGATFVYAGMQKLSDPGYLTPGAPTYIGTQLHQFAHGTPGGFILRALAIPHPGLAGVLAALIELVIGLLVLSGWLTRAAALGGLLMNLLLFLTNSWNTHPYFLGSDIVFVFAWLTIVLAGAAGQPAVDTWLATRPARASAPRPARASATRPAPASVPRPARARATRAPRPGAGDPELTRRAALGGGLLAAATAVLAGLSLVIRSARGPAAGSRTAQLGGGAGGGGAGGGTATSATSTAAASTGAGSGAGGTGGAGGAGGGPPAGAVRLGPLSRLPRGQAAIYRDPGDGSPDIAIRAQDGAVTALSAICTHAGCEVSYEPGGSGGQLVCPCHGSIFDATSGAVIQGPAVSPLPKRTIVVHGGVLYAVRV